MSDGPPPRTDKILTDSRTFVRISYWKTLAQGSEELDSTY